MRPSNQCAVFILNVQIGQKKATNQSTGTFIVFFLPRCPAAEWFPPRKTPSGLHESRPLACSCRPELRVQGPPFCTVTQTQQQTRASETQDVGGKKDGQHLFILARKYQPVRRLCKSRSISVALCLHPLNARSVAQKKKSVYKVQNHMTVVGKVTTSGKRCIRKIRV